LDFVQEIERDAEAENKRELKRKKKMEEENKNTESTYSKRGKESGILMNPRIMSLASGSSQNI